MILDTIRLRLIPYKPVHLLALIDGEESFAKSFGFEAATGLRTFLVSSDVDPNYVNALKQASQADPFKHGFAIVHVGEGVVIGNIGFKGPPDANGAIEIAYAVVPEYQNQGYATEAAYTVVRYALQHPGVQRITAYTLPEENASTHVLESTGFKFVKEMEDPEDGLVWFWERSKTEISIHDFLDFYYGAEGIQSLASYIKEASDLEKRQGPVGETPLHVAVRRRQAKATQQLLASGANVDATTKGGKTPYAHAVRRGFDEIVSILVEHGADPSLQPADQLAVALSRGEIQQAKEFLRRNPELAKTGNPEEDRILADMAGRDEIEPVMLLLEYKADLKARGLDDGTALHQAAWFGQPKNLELLLDAGASLEIFDSTHFSSPLGWAVHGSRNSGDAKRRQEDYVICTKLLLDAGAKWHYPGRPDSDAYLRRLLADGSASVEKTIRQYIKS